MRVFEKSTLKNGIRVLSEHHSGSRAVAMGIFVEIGTRDEKRSEIGISHLLEHLAFKGTNKRSAYQIALALESLGGDLNAYTTREYTCYHSLVLKEHWRESLDILADLVSNMKMVSKDYKLEKSVILQEIAMSEESPEDWIYDEFFKCAYGQHGLGRSILGEIKTIAQMKQKQVQHHYDKFYTGPQLIVAAAGHLDHEEFVKEAKKKFGQKSKTLVSLQRKAPEWQEQRLCLNRDTEQLHFIMGWPTSSFNDEDRFCAYIVNALLGGGMTSRLYQSVREKKGMVYSIYSSLQTFIDCGFMNIYAATDKSKIKALIKIIQRELKKLKNLQISQRDLDLYKTQIKGSLLLGSDDVENRLASIGVNEMVFGDYRSPESIIEEVDKIDLKRVQEFLKNRFPVEKASGLIAGPQASEFEKWWKAVQF